jgi:hypothetical protein
MPPTRVGVDVDFADLVLRLARLRRLEAVERRLDLVAADPQARAGSGR